ncbi:unnamed protein product, partial [Laminaria digitata]
ASNAGGGGLLDIASRTEITNARVGALLRTFGPLLVGEPKQGEEGVTTLSWVLPRVVDDAKHAFAEVEGLEEGDVIVLQNLKREVSEYVDTEDLYARVRVRDGRFRVAVATDGVSTMERRARQGVSADVRVLDEIAGCVEAKECGEAMCPGNHTCDADNVCVPRVDCLQAFDTSARLADEARERYIVRDPLAYGDPLVISVYTDEGELKQQITTFEENMIHDNLLYPKGAPLAALADGWGISRQTPRMRRFFGLGAMILEPADPAVWATHYQRDPLSFPYEEERFQTGTTH